MPPLEAPFQPSTEPDADFIDAIINLNQPDISMQMRISHRIRTDHGPVPSREIRPSYRVRPGAPGHR